MASARVCGGQAEREPRGPVDCAAGGVGAAARRLEGEDTVTFLRWLVAGISERGSHWC